MCFRDAVFCHSEPRHAGEESLTRSGFKSPVAAVCDRRIVATAQVSTALIERRDKRQIDF